MPLARPDGTGVTGGGVYGQAPAEAYRWQCPTCGNENLPPLEEGCPVCRETLARMPKELPETLTEAELRGAVLKFPRSEFAARSIRAQGLSLPARRTLFRALAHYAEFGSLPHDGLPKHVALAWARLLNQADAEEMAPTQGESQ